MTYFAMEQWIDGFPNWFTILVMVLAVIAGAVAIGWMLREFGVIPHDEPPDHD
jgi:uncharacterized membrane protein AbrB (regulator of aidB expression)